MHDSVSQPLPGSVSPRKLEANRANALKSTGPVSEAGKKRSSANSTRHRILASAATLLAKPNQELQSLLTNYRADFRPSSVHEQTLVDEIAVAAWRMKHLARIETGLLASQMHDAYVHATEEPKRIVPRWRESIPDDGSFFGDTVPPKTPEVSEPDPPALAEEPEDVQELMAGLAWASNPQAFSLLVRYQAQSRRDYYRALKELERVRTGQAGYLPQEPPPEMARPIEPEPNAAASETKPTAPPPRTAAASASNQTDPPVAAPAPRQENSTPASAETPSNSEPNSEVMRAK
ncbi:MAG: hypothetical protein KIT09_17830 [Bryobacteraceae bacterium]|nr:hypothetical protein [Bryobacteraceae bacterium]